MREFFRTFTAQYCNQTKTNSKALNWYRNKWYYVGGGIFVVLAIVMALFGEREIYDRYPMNKNTSFVTDKTDGRQKLQVRLAAGRVREVSCDGQVINRTDIIICG